MASEAATESKAPKPQESTTTTETEQKGNNERVYENAVVVEYPEFKLAYTEDPIYARCPYCRQTVTTEPKERIGAFTLLGAICFLHCFLCCLPFIIPRFKDMDHYCSNCHSLIGRFKRI